jgi:predicted phosphodiesterase
MIKEYQWPESFEEPYESFRLPSWIKNLGIMADIHIPFHSMWALNEAINYFIIKKIDAILLNGDILDCYMLSKFNPDPTKRHFDQEVIAFKEFISILKQSLSGIPIYFKLGNHEERYEKIMISRCPEFLGIPYFDFENVLGCKDMEVNVIKDQRRIYAGKLPIYHGHEVNLKSVAVNPARSLFLKVHASALCSHLHRTSQHTEPSINEDIVCYSTGHLSDEHPKYARENKWNHGISRIRLNEEGDYKVINFGLTENKLFVI